MVKAVLVNGAQDMSGADLPVRWGKPMEAAPNGRQGFGRVNLARSLLCAPANTAGVGSVYPLKPLLGGLEQGVSRWQSVKVPAAAAAATAPTLTVTMCYTDYPGEAMQGGLVNVLELRVEAGGQKRYANNRQDGGTSNPRDNVQKVIWSKIPANAGQYVMVVVQCRVLNYGIYYGQRDSKPAQTDPTKMGGGQDFALAWFWEWDDPANSVLLSNLRDTMGSAAAAKAAAAMQAEMNG
jgi:hypothetical protein